MNLSSESVKVMELTADEKSVSFTSESEQCVKISSADTLNRFTEESVGKRNQGKVSAFFGRVTKAVKRSFLRSDPNRVVHLSPSDTYCTEDVSGTNILRILAPSRSEPANPLLGCLPGQICEEPEDVKRPAAAENQQIVPEFSLDLETVALPGPSTFTPGDNHPTLECLRTPKNKAGQIKYSDLVDPLSPPLSPSKTPEEMSERRRSGSVFRRCAKAVSLFLCRGEGHTQQPSQGSGLKGHSAAIKYTVPEETSLPHKGDCEVDLSASDRGGKIFSSLMSCFGFWRPHGSGDFGEVYEENHKKVEQFFWPQSASSEEIFQPRSDATSFLYESLLSSL